MELHSDFLHSRPSYIFLHRDASWEWWHCSVLPGRARLGHFTLTTPKSQRLKSEGLLFTQATRPLWTLWSSALHCPYSAPYHPQLVEPLLSSLLPWQQTGNLMKYILVHKEEVKHLTSAHISLVQTNYMAVPNFLCSPEGMLVNITNNSHTRQVKKIKSNSASKNNQQGSEPPKLWNIVQNHVNHVPWEGLVSLNPHLCLWRWRGCRKATFMVCPSSQLRFAVLPWQTSLFGKNYKLSLSITHWKYVLENDVSLQEHPLGHLQMILI